MYNNLIEVEQIRNNIYVYLFALEIIDKLKQFYIML